MNNILGPVLAIVATVVLLLLRKLLLSVGKQNRDSYGTRDELSSGSGSDIQREDSLYADPTRGFEEPIPQPTSIAVDEFLAELRARAQRQSSGGRRTYGETQ